MLTENKKNHEAQVTQLISAVSEQKPNHQLIKKYCEGIGLAYKSDILELMSDILFLSGNIKNKKKKNKNFKPSNPEI